MICKTGHHSQARREYALARTKICWRSRDHRWCQLQGSWQLSERPASLWHSGTPLRSKGSQMESSWGLPNQEISKVPKFSKDLPDVARGLHWQMRCILPPRSSQHERMLLVPALRHPMKNPARVPRALCSGCVVMAWWCEQTPPINLKLILQVWLVNYCWIAKEDPFGSEKVISSENALQVRIPPHFKCVAWFQHATCTHVKTNFSTAQYTITFSCWGSQSSCHWSSTSLSIWVCLKMLG